MLFSNYGKSIAIDGISVSAFFMIGAFVFSAIYVFNNKLDFLMIYMIIYSVLNLLITTICGVYPIRNLPFKAVEIACWVNVFIIGYFVAYKNEQIEKYLVLMLWMLPVFLWYFIDMFNAQIEPEKQGTLLLNSVFYILFLLPVGLTVKNNKMRYVFLIITFAAIICSSKRSAIIAFIMAVVVYLVINFKLNKDNRIGRILIIILAMIIAVILFDKIQSAFGIDTIGRLENISTDGGSGRTTIWGKMFEYMKNQDLLEWMLGHGHRTTTVFGGAHNDFLEVLYDSGLIGFGFYIAIIFKLTAKMAEMIKAKYIYADSFAFSIVIFLIESLVSQLVILTQWFLIMSLYWGMIIGHFNRYNAERTAQDG